MLPSKDSGSYPLSAIPRGTYRYPRDEAFEATTDYVKLTFYKYTPPFSDQGGGTAGANQGTYNQSSSGVGEKYSTLHLYMPEDIEGEYGGNWDSQNFSEVARGALGGFGQAAGNDFGGSLKSALDTAATTGSNFLTKGTGVANAISSILGATNFGSVTVNDVFSVTTGQILNPNTEVLYKGPKMRNFSLSFKMLPRNKADADMIRNIIQVFKVATLPTFGGAGDQAASFVTLPQLVDVTFMTGNKANEWVTQYKPSVITNFNVSYTPDGAWATGPDGAPVATKIDIAFQETKMVYANEVSGSGALY
tara:strand:- start:44 stop:961 length:918 start_codon:yes stop_codon:yes gene_type:complete